MVILKSGWYDRQVHVWANTKQTAVGFKLCNYNRTCGLRFQGKDAASAGPSNWWLNSLKRLLPILVKCVISAQSCHSNQCVCSTTEQLSILDAQFRRSRVNELGKDWIPVASSTGNNPYLWLFLCSRFLLCEDGLCRKRSLCERFPLPQRLTVASTLQHPNTSSEVRVR